MGFSLNQIVNKFLNVKTLGSDSIKATILNPTPLVGVNLFNKNTITVGYFPSWQTGALQANSGYDASDYIAVQPYTGYKFYYDSHFAVYDSNKNFIEGHQAGTGYQTYYTSSNAAYIRFGIQLSNQDINQASLNVLTNPSLPNISCREVLIIARKSNTGSIFVGDNTVTTKNFGVELAANESISIPVSNANIIYIVAAVNGEGISYVTI